MRNMKHLVAISHGKDYVGRITRGGIHYTETRSSAKKFSRIRAAYVALRINMTTDYHARKEFATGLEREV